MSKANAVVLFQKKAGEIVLPRGGLKGLEVELFEEIDSWAQRMLVKFKVTKANVIPMLFFLHTYLPNKEFLALLEEAFRFGYIDKFGLIRLYKHQNGVMKFSNPLIHLSDLAKFTAKGKPLFSKRKIVRTAIETKNISAADVLFLLSNNECKALLPMELLEHWIQDGDGIPLFTGSLVIAQLARMGSKLVTETYVAECMSRAATYDPKSGAVQTFLELLYEMKIKKGKAWKVGTRELFADTIKQLIRPTEERNGVQLDGAQKLLMWYITNPLIDVEDREWVEEEMRKICDFYAKMYSTFVGKAKESSPFVVRR